MNIQWPDEDESAGSGRTWGEGELVRELAEEIGFVVIACASLDHVVVSLLGALRGVTDAAPDGWGVSGGRLAERLRKAGKGELIIEQLADRYEAIYQRRNYVVHGLWHVDPDSATDFLVGKPAALLRSSADDHEFWTAMPWDVRELKLLHHEARNLIDEIGRLIVVYLGDH